MPANWAAGLWREPGNGAFLLYLLHKAECRRRTSGILGWSESLLGAPLRSPIRSAVRNDPDLRCNGRTRRPGNGWKPQEARLLFCTLSQRWRVFRRRFCTACIPQSLNVLLVRCVNSGGENSFHISERWSPVGTIL